MTLFQSDAPEASTASYPLVAETHRGRLVSSVSGGLIELHTADGPIELLGPIEGTAGIGDEVELVGVLAPRPRGSRSGPALLVRQVNRL